jgi:hypothetical protein
MYSIKLLFDRLHKGIHCSMFMKLSPHIRWCYIIPFLTILTVISTYVTFEHSLYFKVKKIYSIICEFSSILVK